MVEFIIHNATVVTMSASREIVRNAEIVVEGAHIAEIRPQKRRDRPASQNAIDARGCVVLPGLIHSHLHACQTLCRNDASGMQLLDWLTQKIWPHEAAHDAASMRAAADLTFLECIASGATAALDMGSVHHYDSVFESACDLGFRLVGGKCMMDQGAKVPAGLRETTASSMRESMRLVDRWHGAEDGRLRYAFAPRFVLSCSERLLKQVGEASIDRGIRIHTHASENPTECEMVQAKTGLRNIDYFDRIGILGPHTTLAHCVWLSKGEERLLQTRQTSIAHCPSSNFKLASGVAPIPDFLERGITVGLGADGAPCNNNLDIFTEMRLAGLIHKPRFGATSMPAAQVLEMATLNGARALGLEDEVGALVPGMRADMVVVDLTGPHVAPVGDDILSTIVFAAQGRDVRDVGIDGRCLYRNRQFVEVDAQKIIRNAERAAKRLRRACEV